MTKNAKTTLVIIGVVGLCLLYALNASVENRYASKPAVAARMAEIEKRYASQIALAERMAEKHPTPTPTPDPKIQKYLEVAWVHEVGAGWVLDAEQFGKRCTSR